MAGDEAFRVIPSAHVATRSGHANTLPIDLQQTILIQLQEVLPHSPVHGGQRTFGQGDLGIAEFAQLQANLGRRRSRRRGADGGAAQKLSAGEHSPIMIRAGRCLLTWKSLVPANSASWNDRGTEF